MFYVRIIDDAGRNIAWLSWSNWLSLYQHRGTVRYGFSWRSLPWAGGLKASLSQGIPNRGAKISLVSEAVHMGILALSIGHAGSKRASSHWMIVSASAVQSVLNSYTSGGVAALASSGDSKDLAKPLETANSDCLSSVLRNHKQQNWKCRRIIMFFKCWLQHFAAFIIVSLLSESR